MKRVVCFTLFLALIVTSAVFSRDARGIYSYQHRWNSNGENFTISYTLTLSSGQNASLTVKRSGDWITTRARDDRLGYIADYLDNSSQVTQTGTWKQDGNTVNLYFGKIRTGSGTKDVQTQLVGQYNGRNLDFYKFDYKFYGDDNKMYFTPGFGGGGSSDNDNEDNNNGSSNSDIAGTYDYSVSWNDKGRKTASYTLRLQSNGRAELTTNRPNYNVSKWVLDDYGTIMDRARSSRIVHSGTWSDKGERGITIDLDDLRGANVDSYRTTIWAKPERRGITFKTWDRQLYGKEVEFTFR